jgi:hypothetical protein
VAPAEAADEPVAARGFARVCDPSACLIAWEVVDSDGDGVSDADEAVAGTDPHDAASHPPVRQLADLLVERTLPSFEAGLATMVALPADLIELHEKATGERLSQFDLGAFDVGQRKETMSRLGISAEAMAEAGVDPTRGGLTVGLDRPSKDDGGMPAVRVGGVDVATISAEPNKKGGQTPMPVEPDNEGSGVPTDPNAHGEVIDEGTTKEGGHFTEYADGTTVTKDQWGGIEQKDGGIRNQWGLYRDPNKKYENPDAGDGGSTTVDPVFAQVERAVVPVRIREKGYAQRTVQGWSVPMGDEPTTVKDRRTLISYIDAGDGSEAPFGVDTLIEFDPAQVAIAQPEVRDDLPSPIQHIPKGGVLGPKEGDGCTVSFCDG